MNNILSTKILLRKDTISNWESVNPVLMDGETIIVVESDGNIRLKIGDGIKKYKQLPFIHENAVETKSISQGLYSTARPYGIAGGFKVSADSQFAQAFGINATTSGDNYSFVWNGDNDLTENAYASHGTGTFNINPSDGLSGFYIGEHNLQEIIKNEAPETNLENYYTKIQVEELHNKLSGYAYDLSLDGEFVRMVIDVAKAMGASVIGSSVQEKTPMRVANGKTSEFGEI